MNATEITAPANADIRPITDAELDDVNGGLFFLVGLAAFGTGVLAGYGAVRLVQDLSD
jgi:hypothetical protein